MKKQINSEQEISKQQIQKKGMVKFDPDTAKTLPISTLRKRIKGWSVEREYNGLKLSIEAFESLNSYDLITLFQMLDDYSKKRDLWEDKGSMKLSDDEERKLVYRKFNLKELCLQRNILNKKANRKSISDSFKRWYKTEIIYKYPNQTLNTRYIFEFKVDDNFNEIEIIANAQFLDFCLQENKMVMNWGRLIEYGKNYYALQLDIYIQFRTIKYGKTKNKYTNPNIIKEETLFNHLGIGEEIKDLKEKRRKSKEAFKKFKEITGIGYIFDNKEEKWIKENYRKYQKK